MTRYIAEYEAAFYDGNLVGDPDPNGGVKPNTCPAWFPTPNREITTPILDFNSLADGEVVNHFDTICIRDGSTLRLASPGTWIAYAGGKLWPLSALPTPITLRRKP